MAHPLVGRGGELARLGAALERGAQGPLEVIILTGELGMGKTALLRDFVEPQPQSVLLLAGGSLYGDEEVPYHAIAKALDPLARINHPAIRPLKPLLWGGERTDSATSGTELQAILIEVLHLLASERPLLLVLEDLHFTDQASLSVAQALVDSRAKLRGLLVLSLRPEHPRLLPNGVLHPALVRLQRSEGVSALELAPLGYGAVREWFAQRGDITTLPEELLQRLHQRCGGNPLYLQALVEALRDHGYLVVREGRWVPAGRDLPPTLPRSIVGVITQRLAEVSPVAVRAARLLSAARGPVGLPLLHRALALAETAFAGLADKEVPRTDTQASLSQVSAALQELAQRQLAEELPEGWSLAHELVRETLYRGMAADVRQQTHQWWIECLEERGSDVFELAFHSNRAGDRTRTLDYAAEAGERALELSAFATAQQYLTYALEAAGVGALHTTRADPSTPLDAEGEAELLLKRGEARFHGGDVEGADLDVLAALQRSPSAGLAGRLQLLRARMLANQGESQAAETVATHAVTLLDADPQAAVAALQLLARLQVRQGEVADASNTLRKATTLARAAERPDLEAAVAAAQAHLLRLQGRMEEAEVTYRGALPALEAHGLRLEQVGALGDYGSMLSLQGAHDQASLVLRRAVEVATELGLRQAEGEARTTLAACAVRQLHLEEADLQLDKALKLLQSVEYPAGLARAYLVYGMLHHARRETASAETFLDQAGALAAEAGEPAIEGEVAMELGRAAAARGHPQAAVELWERAWAYFTTAGDAERAANARKLIDVRGPGAIARTHEE